MIQSRSCIRRSDGAHNFRPSTLSSLISAAVTNHNSTSKTYLCSLLEPIYIKLNHYVRLLGIVVDLTRIRDGIPVSTTAIKNSHVSLMSGDSLVLPVPKISDDTLRQLSICAQQVAVLLFCIFLYAVYTFEPSLPTPVDTLYVPLILG